MRLAKILGFVAAGGAAALMLGAATRPSALSQTAPGLWEVSGVPGMKTPVRQCFSDVLALAQFEHRKQTCALRVIRDGTSETTVDYNCPDGGFGRSEIGLVTPRSLRIDTQGISDGLPFHYVAQARRVGDCVAQQAAARH